MNAIEKTSIAKGVAIYIVDRILVEKPMSSSDLESVARSVTEDMGIKDSDECNSIAALAVDYVSNDHKVVTELKDGALWITYKGR